MTSRLVLGELLKPTAQSFILIVVMTVLISDMENFDVGSFTPYAF